MEATKAQHKTPARPGRSYRVARNWVRFGILLAALAVLGPLSADTDWSAYVGALSPFVTLGSLIAVRTVTVLSCLGLCMAVLVSIQRRLFCRWLCPSGLILDGMGRLGRAAGRKAARPRAVGEWLFWITIGSACLGYPLFLCLDPLAMFTSTFSIAQNTAVPARWYAASLLALLLSISWLRPGTWCRQLCPLGATQKLLFRLRQSGLRSLLTNKKSNALPRPRAHISRRAWLGLASGAAVALTLPKTVWSAPRILRPPGALPEPLFSGVCLRCGNCLRACPVNIIQSLGIRDVGAAWITPTLSFERDYCREDCVRCGAVCPSGALQSLTVASKVKTRLGKPKVLMELCLLADERECSHCRRWCPYGAIRYVFSEEDYMLRPEVDLDNCNGCGACETHCPVSPQKAISIEPVE
jgi:ferredoxin-type protein NapF